jgi:hypothetical protein
MQSSLRVTRRALAGWVVAPLAVAAAAPEQQARPAGDAVAPSEARSEFQNAARQLAGVKLPRNVEPASRFEA